MPTLLRFKPNFQETVLPQRVFWKGRWIDEWIEVPELWANYSEWTAAPSIPVAEIEWRYGRVLSEGGTAFAARFREYRRSRYYVKIEYDTHALNDAAGGDTATWYGSLEIEQDKQDGARKKDGIWFASGKNFFTCYGLEQQLAFAEVNRSRVAMPWGSDWTQAGLTFNAGGQRNASGARGIEGTYVFEGRGDSPAGFWTTKDIVEYLLRHHRPTDFNGQAWLPFTLDDGANVLPTWDRPELATHTANVRDLLNSLIARNRLMSYYLTVGEEGGIQLKTFSFTDTTIPLQEPYGASIGYNGNTIRIASERDTGAAMVVKRSSIDEVDQVIAEGAPRTSTATFCFDDDCLAEGWWGDLASEHDEGGQSDPAWPAAGEIEKQQQFVMLFRLRDKFHPVYRRFELPEDWDGLVGDGVGGDRVPLMPTDGNANSPAALGLQDRRFMTALALLEDYDYSTPTNPVELITGVLHDFRKPLVLFPTILPEGETRPGDKSDWTWTTADNASLTLELETLAFPLSVRASVGRDGAFYVDVLNAPQEWIASDDFAPINDIDPEAPVSVNFREMLCTISMAWSQYASGRFPPDNELPFGRDVIRRMTINFGDTFRCDYIAANTVIGLNPDGTLIQAASANAGEYIQDDRKKLQGMAELAYHWYSRTRHAIDFSTKLVTSAIKIGQYVSALGDTALEGDVFTEEINSVVTRIRFESRSTESDAKSPATPAVPTMTVSTDFGELDVLKVMPKAVRQ